MVVLIWLILAFQGKSIVNFCFVVCCDIVCVNDRFQRNAMKSATMTTIGAIRWAAPGDSSLLKPFHRH